VLRHLLGRKVNMSDVEEGGRRGREEQGDVPEWARGWLPKGVIPFLCGSLAGVTSWALIYPVDVSKLCYYRVPLLIPYLLGYQG
jgi:solute carrier family 25 carnitine/acylcarnitine transporter 20/29